MWLCNFNHAAARDESIWRVAAVCVYRVGKERLHYLRVDRPRLPVLEPQDQLDPVPGRYVARDGGRLPQDHGYVLRRTWKRKGKGTIKRGGEFRSGACSVRVVVTPPTSPHHQKAYRPLAIRSYYNATRLSVIKFRNKRGGGKFMYEYYTRTVHERHFRLK